MPLISNGNDFASALNGSDRRLYMVSHFEDSPGTMYITELNQDKAIAANPLPRGHAILTFRIWAAGCHCTGSVTPWGSHLGSEEYEPDASAVNPVTSHFNDYYGMTQALYFDLDPDDTTPGAFSAMDVYDYGWVIEVKVNDFDNVTSAKHYAMGRVAVELAYVMPNQKTAYI